MKINTVHPVFEALFTEMREIGLLPKKKWSLEEELKQDFSLVLNKIDPPETFHQEDSK